jgi:threonine dehydrogenase-like Zn-dependent dehydrogenase
MAVAIARRRHRYVVATDVNPYRLDLKKMGATRVVDVRGKARRRAERAEDEGTSTSGWK